MQAIAFYSLCVLFCLLALDLVNLPFAAFTFLGGATGNRVELAAYAWQSGRMS